MPKPIDTGDLDAMNATLDAAGFEAEPEAQPQSTGASNGQASSFDLRTFLDSHVRIASTKNDNGGTKYILTVCPFDSAHMAPDSYCIQFSNGAICFKCSHNSCASYKWRDYALNF